MVETETMRRQAAIEARERTRQIKNPPGVYDLPPAYTATPPPEPLTIDQLSPKVQSALSFMREYDARDAWNMNHLLTGSVDAVRYIAPEPARKPNLLTHLVGIARRAIPVFEERRNRLDRAEAARKVFDNVTRGTEPAEERAIQRGVAYLQGK